jgi:hypothetical protein
LTQQNKCLLFEKTERRCNGMKTTLSDLAKAKEAAFWGNIKKVLLNNPHKVCHK